MSRGYAINIPGQAWMKFTSSGSRGGGACFRSKTCAYIEISIWLRFTVTSASAAGISAMICLLDFTWWNPICDAQIGHFGFWSIHDASSSFRYQLYFVHLHSIVTMLSSFASLMSSKEMPHSCTSVSDSLSFFTFDSASASSQTHATHMTNVMPRKCFDKLRWAHRPGGVTTGLARRY